MTLLKDQYPYVKSLFIFIISNRFKFMDAVQIRYKYIYIPKIHRQTDSISCGDFAISYMEQTHYYGVMIFFLNDNNAKMSDICHFEFDEKVTRHIVRLSPIHQLHIWCIASMPKSNRMKNWEAISQLRRTRIPPGNSNLNK